MDRYSKSSEGIHQGSKIARNSFGSLSSSSSSSSSSSAAAAHPSSASKINHSTQTTNEHVRLNNNTTTNPSSNINKSHHHVYKEGTGTSGDHLRDELSMATKDKAVQQQLQKSQFYQRGLHEPPLKTQSSSTSNCSSSARGGRWTRGFLSKMESEDDDAAAVATDEDEDIDRKLDPYMYDNVQYS